MYFSKKAFVLLVSKKEICIVIKERKSSDVNVMIELINK